MSKKVDERVVEMRFDNAQFERNVSTSMSTLDKLKKSLNLDGAAKSLENVNAAAKSVSFDNMASSVAALESRFSTLGIVGMRVIENLTDSMMGLAKKTLNFFTSGVVQGGIKRAMNLENAHFQLQGLLKDEEAVSAVMKNVNDSVDGTAYSLDSAATVASQLAASGLRAGDQMFKSLRAVAGVAAMTNSSYDDIGRIFTQVAGQGRLMGQDLLQLSSRGMNAAATLATYLHKSEAEVRDMVSKGQISFEIFAAAMDDAFGEHAKKANETFTGALSNIKAALARIGALFISPLIEQNGAMVQFFNTVRERINEVKKQLEPLADSFTKGIIKIVNVATKYVSKINIADRFKIFSNLIETIKNVFKGLGSVIKPIGQAFKDIFLPIDTKGIISFTESLAKFTSKLKLSASASEKLKSTFKGLFSIIDIGWTAVKAVVSGAVKLFGKLTGLFTGFNGGILTATGAIGNWLSGVRDSIKESNIFSKAINGIVNVLGSAIDALKKFGSYVKGKFKAPGFETFLNILKTIGNAIKKVGMAVVKVMSSIGKALGNAFRNGDIKSLLDLVNGGIITGILLKIKSWVSGFKDLAGEGKSFVKSIKEVLDTVRMSLTAWQQNIKAETIQKIAISIGILAAALWVLSGIDPEKLGSALGAITVLFVELIGALKAFDKLDINAGGSDKAILMMIGMSAAVLILASAVKKIADLDLEGLAKGVAGVGILLAELVGAAKLMSIGGKNISKGASQMVIMTLALKILASVCKDLSKLSWKELAKGVSGIGAILLEFAGFQALMKLIKPKKMLSSALSLALIGAAMEIFANVCAKFGKMEWGDLGKAGAAIAGILVIAAGFGKLSSYAGKIVKSSVALILIGAAMEIFADVCTKFGQTEWSSLGKAGAAVAGILVLAAGFTLLAGLSSKMLSSVISLTIMAAAMEIFADVCSKFGQMEWEELGKAGAAIAGILALAAGFTLLTGLTPGMIASAASLLIMAGALAILTPVLMTLGNMSWGEIVKGIVAIAAAFVIFGVAGALLGPVIPAILGLSAAIVLFSIGCLAAGVGIMALAAGLTALSAMTATAATAIVASLHIIIIGILELIPAIIGSLTDAVVALCQVFIQSVPAICEAIKVLILELTKVLVECVPALVDGVLKLIVGVLEALVEYMPQIVNGVANLLITLIDSLATRLPEFVSSMVNFLVMLFDSISSNIAPLIESLVRLFGAIFQGVASALGPIIESVLAPILDTIKNLIVGIAEAIAPYIPTICDAFTQITTVISNAVVQIVNAIVAIVQQIAPVINSITMLVQQLGNSIMQILMGIAIVIQTCGNVIAQAFQGIANVITSVGDAIRNSLEGLASVFDSVFGGIADVITSVGDSIRNVLDGISGVIDSISEAALNAGTGFEKLANGVKTITELNLIDMATSMGAVAKAIGKISSHSEALAASGKGMQQIANGTELSAQAFTIMSTGITMVTANLSAIGSVASGAMSALKSSIAGTASSFVSMSTAAASASASVTASIASMSAVCSNAARTMATSFSSVGRTLMSNMANGIRAGGSNVRAIMTSLLTALVSTAKSRAGQFTSIGRTLAVRFASGVKSGSSMTKSAFSSALMSAVSNARSYYSSFYSAGSYVAQGFADGIKDNRYKAEAQARIMAQNAATAAAKALKINSPSKVFRAIAYSIPEGFAQGIDRKSGMAEDSAVSMAKVALNSTKNAISRISELINSDIDAQPTIRPVVDLSDVTAGAGAINGLFTMQPSIGVLSRARSISSMMNENQNGDNSDVISAIKDLGHKIEGTSGNTYNVNGITYDDGTNVSNAIGELVRAAKIERRT